MNNYVTSRILKSTGLLAISVVLCISCSQEKTQFSAGPVDYVNPYMGNISHLLVPTYPTIHLPNSMLRVYPERGDYTGNRINGLPLMMTGHRRSSAFNLSPYQGDTDGMQPVIPQSYDQEKITPYHYQVFLDEARVEVDYAPSHQSAAYQLRFDKSLPPYLIFSSRNGSLSAKDNTIQGYQYIDGKTKVYLYAETDIIPDKSGKLNKEGDDNRTAVDYNTLTTSGRNAALVLAYPAETKQIRIRYGISFIDEAQAKKNLHREISGYEVGAIAEAGRDIWNNALNSIEINGGGDDDKTIFYTSLYRCLERPVCISEDGRYYSGFDGNVHQDNGRPFYTDDWLWDTYRATHPLRTLIDSGREADIIHSFLLMAEQRGTNWMPTFPGITGDSHSMNSNHGVASIIDAYLKGITGFDLEKAYNACKQAIEGKTLIPWSDIPAGVLDDFYKEHGYFPALSPGEKETVPGVSAWEKRQPVAVTLGTAYDEWCLSLIAKALGKTEEAEYYLKRSYNYRNLFNPETGFFHPKDKDGNFIEGIDYRYDGGLGARDYYDENNAYVYRWDVQHNIGDLVNLIGGDEAFINALENMYNTPLGKSKWEFYAVLPDHTGNVGQFSMANEPSLHIPYLYNYAGQPWKTQKRIRTLLNQWFRNDLMGIPGDEDGGGLSAFVVFSQLGFYPVTPGSLTYNIGSPVFPDATIRLSNGNRFVIKAYNASAENKYIQSAKLNGKELNQAWFNHSDVASGGILELEMGAKANLQWGTAVPPPSASPYPGK